MKTTRSFSMNHHHVQLIFWPFGVHSFERLCFYIACIVTKSPTMFSEWNNLLTFQKALRWLEKSGRAGQTGWLLAEVGGTHGFVGPFPPPAPFKLALCALGWKERTVSPGPSASLCKRQRGHSCCMKVSELWSELRAVWVSRAGTVAGAAPVGSWADTCPAHSLFSPPSPPSHTSREMAEHLRPSPVATT